MVNCGAVPSLNRIVLIYMVSVVLLVMISLSVAFAVMRYVVVSRCVVGNWWVNYIDSSCLSVNEF